LTQAGGGWGFPEFDLVKVAVTIGFATFFA
jgi:hypothetical protein